jgi:hypothetical protein
MYPIMCLKMSPWLGGRRGMVAKTMHTHVSKCKNDKNKKKDRKKKCLLIGYGGTCL